MSEFRGSFPKTVAVRSPALRVLYTLIPCQWQVGETTTLGIVIAEICGITRSCCGAHSNWVEFGGKGQGRKADDTECASLCLKHHAALDQGSKMTYDERQTGWLGARDRTRARLNDLAREDRHVRGVLESVGLLEK